MEQLRQQLQAARDFYELEPSRQALRDLQHLETLWQEAMEAEWRSQAAHDAYIEDLERG